MKKKLKDTVLSILLSVYTFALRVLRTVNKGSITPSSVLVLPPYSPGSLGDEAVLTSGIAQLRAQGFRKINLIAYAAADDWRHLGALDAILNMEDYFTYGAWRVRFHFARLASRCEQFFVFGTDVMDGYYSEVDTIRRIRLAALAAQTGTPARIVSFSFNEHPLPSAVQALRALPSSVKLFSRDPISRERLTSNVQRPAELVADCAFLLEPEAQTELVRSTASWIRAQKDTGRTVVGINANHVLLEQIPNLKPERLIQAYAAALSELFVRFDKLSFLLVPHDIRGEFSDAILADRLMEAVAPNIKPTCRQVPIPCKPAEIKAICADLDIVLSGKMHLAIGCLGQGTPVACIAYQDKFEGLFKHFELEGMTIKPEEALQPGKLSHFFAPLIEKQQDMRNQIQQRLPHVKRLAQTSFQ